MKDDTIGLVLLGFLACCLALLLLMMLLWWRPRWFLLQHINDPSQSWTPMKLWGLKDCAPLCFMFYRVAGPYATEQDAKADAQKATEKRAGGKPVTADT